jgi:N6-adenosine-specific RNA methylase IME4
MSALQLADSGIYLPPGLTREEWEQIGCRLGQIDRVVMWHIGEWWMYGEGKYQSRRLPPGCPAYQTCVNAANCCRKFLSNRRRLHIPFTYHAEVAALTAESADELLDEAEAKGWSRRELRLAVHRLQNTPSQQPSSATCTVSDLDALVAAGRRFGCIYADPPWLYANQATRASTGNHYGGMTVEALCDMPVGSLALPDAHLHLWTTNAFLFDAPRIFAAWGFEFRSSFVWVKSSIGIGNYWRNSHEILLTAIRGDARRFNDHSLRSWMECDRGLHSAKPEQVRGMLERASPAPYLELFGRLPAERWTVWGDQIERNLLFVEAAE